jgi:hypothetical protein
MPPAEAALDKARQSGVVDAAEFAFEISRLHVQVRERCDGAWIFLGPVEPGSSQQLHATFCPSHTSAYCPASGPPARGFFFPIMFVWQRLDHRRVDSEHCRGARAAQSVIFLRSVQEECNKRSHSVIRVAMVLGRKPARTPQIGSGYGGPPISARARSNVRTLAAAGGRLFGFRCNPSAVVPKSWFCNK